MASPSKRHTIRLVLGGVCCGAVIGCCAWFLFVSVGLYSTSTSHAEKAVTLQAIASGLTLLATVGLLTVTAWYAVVTRRILKQSGPVVSVALKAAWMSEMGPSMGALVGTVEAFASGWQDERYTLPAWAVEIRNSGNAPTRIEHVSIRSDGKFGFESTEYLGGMKTPCDLAPHSGLTFYTEMHAVLAAADAFKEVMGSTSTRLRADVSLGSGDEVCSKWVLMAPLETVQRASAASSN